jgi:hypothetical protein
MRGGYLYSTIIALVALLVFGTPAYAANIDIGIESFARNSYAFMAFIRVILSKLGIEIAPSP